MDKNLQPFFKKNVYINIHSGYKLENIMPNFMTRNEEIILLTILKLKDNAYGVSIRRQIYQERETSGPLLPYTSL